MTHTHMRIALQVADYLAPDEPLIADRMAIAAMEWLDEAYKAYLRNRESAKATKVLLGNEDFLKVLVCGMYLDLCDGTIRPRTRKALVRLFVALVAAYSLRRTILIAMVGATRVLHRYRTSRVRNMYEFLTNRNLDDTQISRAKRLLMDMLMAKLHPFITVTIGPRNERGIRAMADSTPFAPEVYAGLDLFAPHATNHVTVDAIDKTRRDWRCLPQEVLAGPLPADAHLAAFHNLFHSGCFSTMAIYFNKKSLGPSVPDFTFAPLPEALPDREECRDERRIEMLMEHLVGRAGRPRINRPASLEVRVDGEVRAQTHTLQERLVVHLEESDFLVRVVAIDRDQEMTIGTYLLTEQDFGQTVGRFSLNTEQAAEQFGVQVDIGIEAGNNGRSQLTVWTMAKGNVETRGDGEKDLSNIEEIEHVVAPGTIWPSVA